ncbi:hypothetical protein [Pseudomonas syringae group genomosp. 3]|uniref:hypothetical protein n=1 Tax=Pseudomonas syringae group genomosp. 3 TaxID=251701 RepID=UPI000F004E01|nr:hypothetical protein [Pseudomonas syringae group genomosp. 3]
MRPLNAYVLTLFLLSIGFTTHAAETVQATSPVATDQELTRAQFLKKKYGGRLHFRSSQARITVESFDIDCHASDGRYLPLMSLLLARLSDMQRKDAWMETSIEQRGTEVRVYDQIKRIDGLAFEPVLALELNQWGELKPISIRAEAIRNACVDGPYGRLWVSGS